MFQDWLSGELRSWYVQSPHKDRIDFVGARLQELKYLPVVVRLHLHEWVRFARHLEEHALALPCSVHDPEVPRYLAVRFPSGSLSRRRGIRASIRIFLEMDGDGRFTRRALAPCRATNALFQQAVPAYLDFLRKHHGVAAKTALSRIKCPDNRQLYLSPVSASCPCSRSGTWIVPASRLRRYNEAFPSALVGVPPWAPP